VEDGAALVAADLDGARVVAVVQEEPHHVRGAAACGGVENGLAVGIAGKEGAALLLEPAEGGNVLAADGLHQWHVVRGKGVGCEFYKKMVEFGSFVVLELFLLR